MPAKSNQVRVREGMRGHRPLRSEPQHKHGAPERPKLSANAAKNWDRLIEDMDPLILRRADKDALATLCEDEARLTETRAEFERLREKLKRESAEPIGSGLTEALISAEGKALFHAIREQTKILITQRREFGLTPSSRSRVAGSNEPSSQVDDAIFGNAADLLVLQRAG